MSKLRFATHVVAWFELIFAFLRLSWFVCMTAAAHAIFETTQDEVELIFEFALPRNESGEKLGFVFTWTIIAVILMIGLMDMWGALVLMKSAQVSRSWASQAHRNCLVWISINMTFTGMTLMYHFVAQDPTALFWGWFVSARVVGLIIVCLFAWELKSQIYVIIPTPRDPPPTAKPFDSTDMCSALTEASPPPQPSPNAWFEDEQDEGLQIVTSMAPTSTNDDQ